MSSNNLPVCYVYNTFPQALDLPKEYYPITDSLTEEAIKECRLSSLQLEGIIHAVSYPFCIMPYLQGGGDTRFFRKCISL